MIVGRQVCALSQAACCGLEFSSWTHSVQQQPDFLSPWKAVENAAELARELDSAHSTHPIAELLTEVRKPKSQRRMVTFDSDIQLIFHQDSICAMTMIPHPGLQNWVDKPWHLAIKRCHKEVEESTALYPHVRDLWCDNWQSSPIPSDGTQPTEQFVEQQPIQDPQHEFDHTAPYTFHNSTTPWRSRLLDEHNRVRVGDGSDEHTQVDGPDRTGDPEDEQLVIIDGWQDLLEILHQNTPSPDSLIHLEMYGLHITHHSIRITDCEATIAAIREAVQQSWSDAMPPRSVAYLHLVRPQEHRHARAVVIQMIVEIVPFGVDIPPNDVPILRRIKWHSDHSITLETAYMRDHQTGYELLFDAHLDEWCHPRNGVQCNLHIESHTALMAHRHRLLPGSLLEIFIHDDDRPGVPVSSSASSQHVDPQPRTQQSAIGSLDVLQEWLVECSCSHVSLVMYGLCGSSLGTRYATSQAEHQQVRSAVLQAWQDYVQPDTAVTLHMVRPQDDQRPDHLHLIVELTGPSQVRPAGYLPILQRISWHNIWQGDTSAAVYRVSGLNMRQLLTACSLSEWCGPSTRAICRIQVERQLLPISANIDLLAGSLLEILVSLQPNEDEAASFLQGKQSLHTSVSTSHPHVSDRWCDDMLDTCPLVKSGTPQGSKDQNGPPVLTCRPNAAITLEFDDFIPLPNGGRIIPPPNWRQNSLLRYASNNEAVFRDRSGFLTVDCRTWLLPHGGGGYRQPRDLRIQAQLLIHLTERIRHLWRDVVAPSDALRVQHVRPTPLARGNQQQLPKLHLLVEVNRPLGDISRPILFSFQQISAQGLSDEVDWLPSLTEEVVTLQSILQVSSLECAARNLLVPLADRARGWMGTQQQRHVAPGAYIPIWWDLRWNADPEPAPRGDAISTPVDLHDMDDLSLLQQLHGGQQQGNDQEEDVLTLMQRSASRSPRRNTPMSARSHDEENRVPVHTFRMSSSYRKVVLERSQEMTYIPQLTRLWQVPPHNPLLAVHQVWHGPADLESGAKATLLLELASDRNRQAIADDQMVLVDIALESSGDTTTIRRVLWTRRFMTRPSFLHLLSVQEFCNSPATDCHVEKNKVTWHKQDTFSREFRSGDYVRLLVRGPTTMTPAEVQVVLCEQEGADAQRYLYTRSPSHSPEPSAHSAEGAESEFQIFQDSPVESLTLTRQKDEKDPFHGGPISQNTPSKQNLEHLSSQGHPLAQCRPGFKPHVSDRWCASHGLDTEEIGVPVKSLPPIFALDELYSQRREPFANWTNKDLSMRSSPQANPEMAPKLLILDDLIPPSNLLSPSDANPGVTSTSHPLEEKDIACYEDPISVPISLPGLPDFADKLTSPYLQLSQNIPTSQQVGEDHATLVDDWNRAVDFAIANQHHDPEQIAIYTDGSKLWNEHLIEDTSGWSFVVAAKWPSSLQWGIVGHSSASVNLTADSDSWIGATAHQSYQSELEAIIRALLWLCQSPWIHGGMQCTLISDATSALYAVDGSFTVRHIYFSKVVRPLCKFVDSLAPIALRWEKAHAGQIFNELADHLAGKAARSAPQTFQASIIHPIRDQQLLAWLWFCGNARQIYPELPKVDSSGFHLPIPRPLKCVDFQRPKVDVSGYLALDFQALTCNINSFKDDSTPEQLSWKGRAELIRQQALELGAHCLCWQETRRRYTGMWTSNQFAGFEVASDDGKGGVALWFRTDIPFAVQVKDKNRHPVNFNAKDFTILHAHHELLVVKYRCAYWKAIFISAHAPNDTTTDVEKEKFWNLLTQVLLPFDGWPLVLGIDANARIGGDYWPGVGNFSGDIPNDNGQRFLRFLQHHRMCVPATFEKHVVSPTEDQGTWLSKGGWKRIDFIAYPISWLHNAQFATWAISIEKDVLKDDHKAACVRCRVAFPVANQTISTTPHVRLRVDTAQINTNEGRKLCSNIMDQMLHQQPGFEASADVHAAFLQQTAQEQLTHCFPAKPRVTKPSWISDETWNTVGQTRAVRRKLQQLRVTWTKAIQFEIFYAWKVSSRRRPACRAWLKQHDFETACALQELYRIRRTRCLSLRADEAAFLDRCARSSHDELNEAKGTDLWKKIRYNLPKYRRRRHQVLPFESTQEAFLHHFANIEDATIQTEEDLRKFSTEHSSSAIAAAIHMQVASEDLPSVYELEDAIRDLQVGRSSIGCLPAEFLRADPAASATLLFPSLLALFRFFQQPMSWKGGQYYPLFKGKGSAAEPAGYRAILIGNAIPKVFHKILRKRLSRCVAPSLLPFQIGGLPRMSVHFAAHFLTELRNRAHGNRRSNAVIFFDLKSAFYRAQRSTIVSDLLNYQEDCQDEDVTLDVVGRPDALASMDVSVSLRAVLQEVFSGTWNTVTAHNTDSTGKIMRSVRGTRPGDPVADLAFTCVMRQILQEFVHAAGDMLPSLFAGEGQVKVPPITWVDDVAIFLEADTATQVREQARSVVSIMASKCRSFGLDINFAPGKSEVLFQLHGRDAAKLRTQLHHDKTLDIGEGCWSSMHVSVTSRYTHLGIVHTANQSFDIELQYRLARGMEAMRECRKTILANPAIPPHRRWTLARSLILSRVFFACEIWPPLTSVQTARINSFVVKVARNILGKLNYPSQPHTTDDDIISQLQVPSVDTILRAARLRYVARVWKFAPCQLQQLLTSLDDGTDHSWLHRIRIDFQWLHDRSNRVKHFPDPMVDDRQWWDLVKQQEWNAMIRRVCDADTVYTHYMARYRVWRQQFRTAITDAGVKLHQPTPEPTPTNGLIECPHCDKSFATPRALSVHQYKVHGNHADVRQFISDTVCGACLKDFHSLQRVRQHLQYKQHEDKCLRRLQAIWWPHPPIDLPRKAELKSSHRLPAFRVQGPQLPSREQWLAAKPGKNLPPQYDLLEDPDLTEYGPAPEGMRRLQAQEDMGINEVLLEELVFYVITSEIPFTPPQWGNLRMACNFQTVVKFGEMLQNQLVNSLDPQLYAQVHPWLEDILAAHFVQQRDEVCPADSQPRASVTSNGRQASSHDEPLWIQDAHGGYEGPDHQAIPRLASFGRTYYVLYAYSGHRRQGDILEWMEHFQTQFGVTVQVLTIDIVYDAELCDLQSERAKGLWLNLVKRGYFMGLIGAPPCETWSIARFRSLLDENDHGPTPLRLSTTPWGREANSWQGQCQVLCANDLLQVWFMFMAYAIQVGTAFLMEHPARSTRHPLAPSVWKLPELQWILKVPGVCEHLVHQGWYGARSSKPTMFLSYNLPAFKQTLDVWWDRATNPLEWIALVGKDETGRFKTEQAKAYPGRLNAAIAQAFIERVVSLCEDGAIRRETIPEDFCTVIRPVVAAQATSGMELGPDFAMRVR